jgi:hypothetical protein
MLNILDESGTSKPQRGGHMETEALAEGAIFSAHGINRALSPTLSGRIVILTIAVICSRAPGWEE